jgi:transcriptional regulator with XRE-family HTH domain
VSNFAENLRRVMFKKRLKAIDVARETNITPSVISRYLSGTNQPSRDNLFALANYLGVSSESLISSSDASEMIQSSKGISSSTDSLLKVIEVQGELIKNLQKQVQEWEDWKARGDRHVKGKAKADQAINKNKEKVGFLKRRKPKS